MRRTGGAERVESNQRRTNARRGAFGPLLASVLVSTVVATTVWFVWTRNDRTRIETTLTPRLVEGVIEAKNEYGYAIGTAVDDLLTFRALASMASSTSGSPIAAAQIGVQMLRFKDRYDQVRVIDSAGIERVRADRDALGTPRLRSDLADLSDSEYVYETLGLDDGKVYVSAIDLSVENGVVVLPPKPTMRVAAPMYTEGGALDGLAIVNVLAEPIIEGMVAAVRTRTAFPVEIFIVDALGNILYGPTESDRWSNLLRSDPADVITLADRDPQAWRVVRQDGNRTDTNVGIVVSRGLDPSEYVSGARVDPGRKQFFIVHADARMIARSVSAITPLRPWIVSTLLFLVAAIVFLAIRISSLRARQRLELQEAAFTDALTGFLNRRSFELVFSKELARLARSEEHASFVVFDLDHFKNVNDTYGHSAGDDVLRAFARSLLGQLRDTDYVARWGGEEFVVLLSGTSGNAAWLKADAIRKTIESAVIIVRSTPIRVTVSGGIVDVTPGRGVDLLFQEADRRLYLAKNGGRNRIVGADVPARSSGTSDSTRD